MTAAPAASFPVDPTLRHRYAIVASTYHGNYIEPMVAAARATFLAQEPAAEITVWHSPGSFEIPVIVGEALRTRCFDAVLALGLIWRGQTLHAELIARAVTEALMRLALENGRPVIHEVLTVETAEQAAARCGPGEHNRGIEAARAAMLAVRELHKIREWPTPRGESAPALSEN